MERETPLTADDLPASPVPMQPEIKQAAADIVNAEYWLYVSGWRELIQELNCPGGDRWLRAYKKFRGRIDRYQRAIDRNRLSCFIIGVVVGACVVGWVALAVRFLS